ncbi:HIT finger domain protein [Aspergillus sclerotioniger CBS 115572]|uniref:HIT finger domain protein n=1 Tax=Aspergillus sclerotioniger CBS 115572 TaxID=1450535 RepID=A0A317XAG1_9EURO|nr:HIT finger domain protein [Aspergillus sclerotioniger CBS 115572]PWY95573.1 HIT finger domain protein [Aspergillus sclerotioniger CBS 115572]
MPGTCEVCVSEPSKYRCPTCGLMSCSLACTQSHKIYCAPKAPSPKPSDQTGDAQPPSGEANGNATSEVASKAQNGLDLRSLRTSTELKDLLDRFPSLREELYKIYKETTEEAWPETQNHGGRARPWGRGRPPQRNRGPWTREKGFNRGVGRVRKLRERCEEGLETGKKAEGFVRFMALITGNEIPQEGM